MTKTLFGGETRKIKSYDKIKGIHKPVLQIKDGVIVNRFNSIGEAGRMTNITASGISHVCRGKFHTIGGYAWKYADYDLPEKKNCKKQVTAIKTQKKSPFKVVITEMCNSKEDAIALLNSLSNGTKNVNPFNARIIQTRNKK